MSDIGETQDDRDRAAARELRRRIREEERRSQLAGLGEGLSELTMATNQLVERVIEPVSRIQAIRVNQLSQQTTQLRDAVARWRVIMGVLLSTGISVLINDLHLHRVHLQPLEDALSRLPETSHLLPLFPRAPGWAPGLAYLALISTAFLVSAFMHTRAVRRLRGAEYEELRQLDGLTVRPPEEPVA